MTDDGSSAQAANETPAERAAHAQRLRAETTRLASRSVALLESRITETGSGSPAWVMRHRLAVIGLLACEAMVWPEPCVDDALRRYAGLVAIELGLDRDYVKEALTGSLGL